MTKPGKYRKKPVVIEAIQLPKNPSEEYLKTPVSWINDNGGRSFIDQGRLNIYTLEGIMEASPGDWIIKGVSGEFYPCKPDIFDKTYERVS